MNFYMAPLEGVTGYVFRNAYEKYFGGIDKYYAPFIVAHSQRDFHKKELKDILPENNTKVHLVPQILANKAEDFCIAVKSLEEFGYKEVNFNLGCPSKTVVSKKRGAAFLKDKEILEHFFDEVFSKISLNISVKTRLGMDDESEFEELLAVFNRFPISELIIHPRLQCDYYKGKPRLDSYTYAYTHSHLKLCYNGDIFTVNDYKKLSAAYPETENYMLGRGILKNPGLISEIKTGECMKKETFRAFHDELCQEYVKVMSGDVPVLFKMKEMWSYMHHMFEDDDKYMKKMKKAQKLNDYYRIVDEMFLCLNLQKKEDYNE